MPSKRTSATIGDYVRLQRGTTYKGPLVGKPGPALLGLGSIVPGGGFRGDYKTYGGDCPPELMLTPGDLYVSLKGATKDGSMVGSIARLPQTVASGRITQDTVRLIFHSRDESFERYLYWLLRTPDYRNYCAGRAAGSVVSALSRTDFLAYPVPPLTAARHRLVDVLETMDNKIDSNRRLASLLEETAATLFRAQFVDFVGVEEFADSEIGPIPRGWRAGSLLDVAAFVNGKAFTKYANGVGRPILRIRELNNGIDAQTLRAELNADDANIARSDDILFAWSGSLAVYRWPGQESLINQHIFKVLPKDAPSWFVHQWITEHMPSFRATAASKATTMGHIQRSHLADARLPVPPADVLAQADSEIGPLDTQRAGLVQESRTLTEIRDALLPKLISGEIRVPDTADPAEVVEPLLA